MQNLNKSFEKILKEGVELIRQGKRTQKDITEWFFVQEIRMEESKSLESCGVNVAAPEGQAQLLCRIAERIPLSILHGSVIAGSQDCAFSPSYALINPNFKVEEFAGYCDPAAIYEDIQPDSINGLNRERIAGVRTYWENTSYVKKLQEIYAATGEATKEVLFFMEPVTGHTIPDIRPFLKYGVREMQKRAKNSGTEYGNAMAKALDSVLVFAKRYREITDSRLKTEKSPSEKARIELIIKSLNRIPDKGAENLHEAIQMFALLWQAMVLEQAPNPYAFSVGNLDRILAPYYDEKSYTFEEAVALVRHLLTFFQVGDRCWAISQNVMVGGRDANGKDLTTPMTEIVLEAFFQSNDPQPALSVKVHRNTPDSIYRLLGRFFFTQGHSTPSLLNDDMVFEMLRKQGITEEDLPDYSIAGCQEPLIMGKSSLNTTNTWLNLAKILELSTNDGLSLISGKRIAPSWKELGFEGNEEEIFSKLEALFFRMLDAVLSNMQQSGNACTALLGEEKPVPLTSALMDSFYTWRDMRDTENPGVRYNASGCLIHGLSVVADSLHAVKQALNSGLWTAPQIRQSLISNHKDFPELQHFLLCQDKYGNNCESVDSIAVQIADKVSEKISALKNPAGKPFLADWSTPSTHLLYGYWVGATPDGRDSRSSLGYGVDPLPCNIRKELPNRIISLWKLPFTQMTGGYASHIGLTRTSANSKNTLEEKGEWIKENIVQPLFRHKGSYSETPFYVYFNIDSAKHLREVLKQPELYAPNGIYIVRIHGTFVNFLDLSPAIQEDIISRIECSKRD
ncbi:MAG: pyruvate formate lyase family protein [Planctomycetota bacterium]